jgi:hypothetical protein
MILKEMKLRQLKSIHDEYGGVVEERTFKNGKLIKEWNRFINIANSSTEKIESEKTNFYSEDGSTKTAEHTTETININ